VSGPPYRTIRERLGEGYVVPFPGAGASSGVREIGAKWVKGSKTLLPFAGELAEHLAQAASLASDAPRDLSAVASYLPSSPTLSCRVRRVS
jgi:hypothetical protein